MLDYISYILFFSVFAIIFGFTYIRLKFGFWAIQPVFHIYDIKYMINPPGIIDDYLPDKNKYTNFKNIDTSLYVELTQIQKQRLVNLIQANYLQRGDNTFMPKLTGIVPLCIYNTYGFSVNTWVKPPDLSAEYKLVEVNPQNFHILYDFIKSKYHKFDIVINTEVTNIVELIKTKNIFINMIIVDDAIVAAYMFRKSCVQIEKNMEVLACFASISNVEDNIFIQGFKISFWKIAAENYFGFCAIEDISDNNILINNIQLKTKPLVISPTAYFFYNFAYPTFKSNKVLIIN